MSELSTTVEDEPPITPVRTTRAKVVRESFTALRSDFEMSPPPPVVRPQSQEKAPATRDGGQSNVSLTVGGGILLLGCIFAFLYFGYGSNRGSGAATKPSGSSGAASAATTSETPKAPAKTPAKSPMQTAHNGFKEPTHKPALAVLPEHHASQMAPPPREIAESPARQVAPPRPHAFHQIEREPRPLPHERPVAAVPAKPAPHIVAPVHHAPRAEHASAPAAISHHDDGDSNPLHRLDNE